MGLSLSRNAQSTDTNDNATDFGAATPTPGRVGATAIPEPPTGALILLGLAAVLRRRNLSPTGPTG